jgi:hypothetical protein
VPHVPAPPASGLPAPAPALPLPRRTQRARIAKASSALVAEAGGVAAELPAMADFTPPPAELLRRVLDGLRRNS